MRVETCEKCNIESEDFIIFEHILICDKCHEEDTKEYFKENKIYYLYEKMN